MGKIKDPRTPEQQAYSHWYWNDPAGTGYQQVEKHLAEMDEGFKKQAWEREIKNQWQELLFT